MPSMNAQSLSINNLVGKVDFGILTIREDEFEAVLERFPPVGRVSGRRQYNISQVPLPGGGFYLIAVVRCIEQGTGEAQSAAHDLLEDLKPHWLLLIGIAGGVPSEEFSLGDVVVSTRVCDFSVEAVLQERQPEYALRGGPMEKDAAGYAANLLALKSELGHWNSPEFITTTRPTLTFGDESLYGDDGWKDKVRKALSRHTHRTAPLATAGAIASSDRLIKDADLLSVWLKVARQVLAVEMELAGVYQATYGRRVPTLSIRGISDIVGLKRDSAWTKYACHTAAAFALALVQTRPFEPRSHSRLEGHSPSDKKAPPPFPAEALPTRPPSARRPVHPAEAHFKEVVHPWIVSGWKEHEHSVDALIEIAREKPNSREQDATGKRFAAQLIPAESSLEGLRVRVKPEAINHGLHSSELTAIIAWHEPSRQYAYTWIDDTLISDLARHMPDWRVRDFVFLDIPLKQSLSQAEFPRIERQVFRSRRSQAALTQGQYFELQKTAERATRVLRDQATKAGFQSVVQRLDQLEEKLRAAPYVVALTGKSRAGKSTLLNVLVRREVSPVGKLPTTAVSMLVMAGAKNAAEVTFLDGKTVEGPASSEFLAEYATQDKNPDNHKKVRHITIRLLNEELNHGVTFVDAPGLHDASPEIRAVTQKALKSAHLILYVIDVSPHRTGSFSLDQHVLGDLKMLQPRADRVMLVLSKADALESDDRADLLRYIEAELKKYGISTHHAEAPFFISAKEAWAQRENPESRSLALSRLDVRLWEYLLSTSSTGVHRLAGTAREIAIASEEFMALMVARQHSGKQAAELQDSLKRCDESVKQMAAKLNAALAMDGAILLQRMSHAQAELLMLLRKYLEDVPSNTSLPTSDAIVKWLQPQAVERMQSSADEMAGRFNELTAQINSEVEEVLRQVRLSARMSPGASPIVAQVPTFEVPGLPSTAWGGLLVGTVLSFIAGSWWWSIAGYVIGHMVEDDEARRKRLVERSLERSSLALHEAFNRFREDTNQRMSAHYAYLWSQMQDRVRVFVHDVKRQLERTGHPLTDKDIHALNQVKTVVQGELQALSEVIQDLGGDLPLARTTGHR